MAGNRIPFQDLVNPLYLHPFDGPTSVVVEKLQGSEDYRAWKRSMEINLASKRKLGFVTGGVPKPTDVVQAELWETCNHMVIAWLTHNVSPSIMKSIMFMTSAADIWSNLEKRFQLTHRSRKYKLNKEIYELRQHSLSVNDYYTAMRSLWEELDALNTLPTVPNPTAEVKILLETIAAQKDESRLFQFLNGLNDIYNPQRSHFLLVNPLPSVEIVSAALQQEEAQRELLQLNKLDVESVAMFSKMNVVKPDRNVVCTVCNGKGHRKDICWYVVGYPKWHSRYGQTPSNPTANSRIKSPQGQATTSWTSTPRIGSPKTAIVAQVNTESPSLFTPQQLAQLAQLMPQLALQQRGSNTDEELEQPFSGMISIRPSNTESLDSWIIDSGATDHMTPEFHNLIQPVPLGNATQINLPTGAKAKISYQGTVKLSTGLTLKNLKGVGKAYRGLYYIVDHLSTNIPEAWMHTPQSNVVRSSAETTTDVAATELEKWHHRLGHASAAKLKLIPCVQPYLHLPSNGPYKVCTRDKYKYFRTIVDDNTRHTWIYLVQFKSDALSALETFHNYAIISSKDVVKQDHWVQAMNAELEALEENQTWVITPLPPGQQTIGSKWLYKTKLNPDGSILKYKASLVILGCKQQYGIDYHETFAPVAKMTTIRTLLAVAAMQGWHTIQMDVTNAFLHGELSETVYMSLPQGYTHLGCRIQKNQSPTTASKLNPKMVCKLLKSLYGLRQSPRLWFSKFSNSIKQMGFFQSKADYSMFILQNLNAITIILVYVDDVLICGNSQTTIDDIKLMLAQSFKMKDLGPVSYFLGIEIHRSVDGFFLSQKKYASDILQEFGMANANSLRLPMDIKLKMTAEMGDPLPDFSLYHVLWVSSSTSQSPALTSPS
ncbi:uncharacterized protein LOC141691563 [Apium graveolens]|uniref:uncharacterized protein LOC141691563 n=1 Tax=Apium graveolens TaxID=4045 RepID=UPI003D794DC3